MRHWTVTFVTPSVLITPINQRFDAQNIRALLTQNHYIAESNKTFTNFLMDMELLSSMMKEALSNKGVNTSSWMSCIKSSDGGNNGVAVKVKAPHLKDLVMNFRKPFRCVLKITCLYKNDQSSGMALELVDCMEV
jgi:hypothetical protein